jgi:hypothetical protein
VHDEQARLVIEAAPSELALFRPEYESLVEALEAEGYEVEIVERSATADPSGVDFVLKGATSIVAAKVLKDIVGEHLRGRAPHGRRGEIDLPDVEAHRFGLYEEVHRFNLDD